MSELTIHIPWQPQPQVSPNSRNSTRNRRDHHQANADIAVLAVRDHLARELNPRRAFTAPEFPVMDISVYWGKGRKFQDLDNLMGCCKGVIDGVTRELGIDDARFIAFTIAQSTDPDAIGYTSITIREATDTERRRAS
jgi:hypothetical protein